MSGKQSGMVWELLLSDSKGVSKEAKKSVLLAMADHADQEGDNVFPSIGLLAWKTDLSPRQVVRVIKSLREDKLVCLVEENFGKYRTRNYSLTLKNGVKKEQYKNRKTPLTSSVTPPVTPVCHTPSDTQVSPKSVVKPSANRQSETPVSERVAFNLPPSIKNSIEHPAVPKTLEPTTELGKYLAEKSHYGNIRWLGYANAGERDDWLKMERLFAYGDIKSMIDWACSQKGFGKSKLVHNIIAAVNKHKDSRRDQESIDERDNNLLEAMLKRTAESP